ncbi:hypothetical protein TMEN_5050 [Trichophyton mentagrophytes]|nr:hypothetical protein TMEN_5050 [Trichophyton mentagrophytes]
MPEYRFRLYWFSKFIFLFSIAYYISKSSIRASYNRAPKRARLTAIIN